MFISYHYHTYTTTILSSPFSFFVDIFYFIHLPYLSPQKSPLLPFPAASLLLLPPPIITVPFCIYMDKKSRLLLHVHYAGMFTYLLGL